MSNFTTGQLNVLLQLTEKARKAAARAKRDAADIDQLADMLRQELDRRNDEVLAALPEIAGHRCHWCKGWVDAGKGHWCPAMEKQL